MTEKTIEYEAKVTSHILNNHTEQSKSKETELYRAVSMGTS
jgi:hypothetical protein